MNTTLSPDTAQPNSSVSTPTVKANVSHNNDRRRRHTITRPDSALALLSDDMGDTDEDEEQQGTFDRISDILSNLIQEANDAVNSIEHERAQLLQNAAKSKSMYSLPTPPRPSRLPRPKSRASHTPSTTRHRASSIYLSSSNSSSSAVDLFLPSLPPSPTSTATSSSRSPSPTLAKRPISHQIYPSRRSMTPRIDSSKRSSTSSVIKLQEPVLESFKRLDTSLALVDSLSRDLATQQEHSTSLPSTTPAVHSRLTVFLLVPLLHIPHTLISMVFDSISSTSSVVLQYNTNDPLAANSSPNITGMLAWAFFFTLTSLVVDQVAATANSARQLTCRAASRRLSLPGSYLAGRDSKLPEIAVVDGPIIGSHAVKNTTQISDVNPTNLLPATSNRRSTTHRRRRSAAANRSSIYRKRYQTHDNSRRNDDSRSYLSNSTKAHRSQIPSTVSVIPTIDIFRSKSKQPVLVRRKSI
ncbi:hypothetical protein EC973_003062 [Apophysomyces ossiformis]|uniref:Uncharacterized protein n=1 Tax=Apophysomyces ossiformis TaxID=679940 RepID=A0A8H7BHM0_9FUNG|nr:hypothetical protein EC973_003062 [Apophysomyces ossiformis]